MIQRAALIYPHQLFKNSPAIEKTSRVFLVEDPLFFRQYRFHVQKLLLHRLTMSEYAEQLRRDGHDVEFIEQSELGETGDVARILRAKGIREVSFVDPCDDWLESRLLSGLEQYGIHPTLFPDPHFITSREMVQTYGMGKLRFANFYKDQRRRLNILVDEDGQPEQGKWSFDAENRVGMKSGLIPPAVHKPPRPAESDLAIEYVRNQNPNALGLAYSREFSYPINRSQALTWLEDFLDWRFSRFGEYEDAISREHDVLFHSALTPMMNIGLLSPAEVVEAALARRNEVPFNSLEGFVRQIIGWREFMRVVYIQNGRKQRSQNFWRFTNPMPSAFYDGTTGIPPIDTVIQRLLRTGYCHHIERLMVLGNFMMLCEIHPNAVYQWFMEFFIDSYDWVMVPNVYGMSQFADGGLCTTKPYLSGSNYVLKMSDFHSGPWCEVWTSLYWRFIDKHRDFIASQPRLFPAAMQLERMGPKLDAHRQLADQFLASLFA